MNKIITIFLFSLIYLVTTCFKKKIVKGGYIYNMCMMCILFVACVLWAVLPILCMWRNEWWECCWQVSRMQNTMTSQRTSKFLIAFFAAGVTRTWGDRTRDFRSRTSLRLTSGRLHLERQTLLREVTSHPSSACSARRMKSWCTL